MLRAAAEVERGALVRAGTCVVGAGPAGITLALELAQAGHDVVVLESGGRRPVAGTEDRSVGRSWGRPYFDLADTRTRALGGTTDRWAGECRPLDAADLTPRPWVPLSGWPFGIEELAVHDARVRELLQLGRAPYEADDWTTVGVHPGIRPSGSVRTSAMLLSPPTRFAERFGPALEASTRITVHLDATVVELVVEAGGDRVRAAEVRGPGGRGYRVEAERFVLAAGGIENARLLLCSDAAHPGGLGNAHGWVGRGFAEHLYVDDAAWLRVRRGRLRPFFLEPALVEGSRLRGLFTLAPEARHAEGLAGVAAVVTPPGVDAYDAAVPGASGGGPLRRAGRRSRRLARHLVRTRGLADEVLALKLIVEQAPNPASRVVLGDDVDELGVRRAELVWRLSPIDRVSAVRGLELLAEGLAAEGVDVHPLLGGLDDPWPARLRGARHHLGTTRMHADPRHGVVDADGRVHGTDNLYVAGSSVFPTGGTANPTATIVALALRLADHLSASG